MHSYISMYILCKCIYFTATLKKNLSSVNMYQLFQLGFTSSPYNRMEYSITVAFGRHFLSSIKEIWGMRSLKMICQLSSFSFFFPILRFPQSRLPHSAKRMLEHLQPCLHSMQLEVRGKTNGISSQVNQLPVNRLLMQIPHNIFAYI